MGFRALPREPRLAAGFAGGLAAAAAFAAPVAGFSSALLADATFMPPRRPAHARSTARPTCQVAVILLWSI